MVHLRSLLHLRCRDCTPKRHSRAGHARSWLFHRPSRMQPETMACVSITWGVKQFIHFDLSLDFSKLPLKCRTLFIFLGQQKPSTHGRSHWPTELWNVAAEISASHFWQRLRTWAEDCRRGISMVNPDCTWNLMESHGISWNHFENRWFSTAQPKTQPLGLNGQQLPGASVWNIHLHGIWWYLNYTFVNNICYWSQSVNFWLILE